MRRYFCRLDHKVLVRSLMIQMRRPPRLPGDIKDSTMPANLQFRRGGLADRRGEPPDKRVTMRGMVAVATTDIC